MYSLSMRVRTTMNHISIFTFLCFLRQYQRQRKCFLSECELKKALLDTLTRAAWLGPEIFDWFVLSMRMQVILDSSFARPGSAPIWGGKKGELSDWTSAEPNSIKFDFKRLWGDGWFGRRTCVELNSQSSW